MACMYPIRITNERYGKYAEFRKWNRNRAFYVPCGKCIQCQKAKRGWIETGLIDELKRNNGIGAFVTLTYTDEEYVKLIDESGIPKPDYRHIQLYFKQVRNLYKKKYGSYPNMKYVVVAEQGEKNKRWHFHAIVTGIDWKVDKMIFWNAWKRGIVDAKPCNIATIKYVLKYMDKFFTRCRSELTDWKREQKPIMKCSKGLGEDFIKRNIIEIRKNNGVYDRGDGVKRTIPVYWQNKLQVKPIIDMNAIREKIAEESGRAWNEIPKKEILKYIQLETWNKEQQAIDRSRRKHIPQPNIDRLLNEISWAEKIEEI